MTRKPRRPRKSAKSDNKAPEAKQPVAEATEHDSEPAEPTRAEDGGVEQGAGDGGEGGATEGAKKIGKLPAFGFAADLLAAAGRGGSEDDAPEVRGGQEAMQGEDGSALESPASERYSEVVGDGETGEAEASPDRIFQFADSLEHDEAEEAEAAKRITTWITFNLADEIFALPVTPVREVLRIAHITRVPHAPRPIRGVTNLRGRVIPIIDLRVRIELPAAEVDRSTRAIVVGSRGRLIGLMVDAVHQVVHIDLNRVQPPPDDVMTVQSDYLSGVYQQGDQLILLLDVDRALIIRESEDGRSSIGTA